MGDAACLPGVCAAYADGLDDNPGKMPVGRLASYMRTDKKFGRIATPRFEIIGWASAADLANGKKTNGKKATRVGGAR